MENNLMNVEYEDIKNLIYTVRGKQVMLDSDVARLYKYETKQINETVKRNIKRFPENFRFQLREKELSGLRSQIATANPENSINISHLRRFSPYVFTEQRYCYVSTIVEK